MLKGAVYCRQDKLDKLRQWPRILLDWQIMYTQQIVPLLIFGKPKQQNVWLRVRGQVMPATLHIVETLSVMLLFSLLESTGGTIAGYKTQAKHALKHVATAKNRRVDNDPDPHRREMHCPRSSNGKYRPPYTSELRLSGRASDNTSDEEPDTSFFPFPQGRGSHVIHNSQCQVIEWLEKAEAPILTILTVARFFWQSRANTVATEEMTKQSLKKWVATLTTPPMPISERLLTELEQFGAEISHEIAGNVDLSRPLTILLNTSAKIEATTAEGGTAAAITALYADRVKEETPVYDMATMTVTRTEVQEVGNATLSCAIQDVLSECDGLMPKPEASVLEIRPLTVLEISKSRSASVGRLAYQILLSVISDIGLDAISQLREAKNTMRGGNLAFRFVCQLDELPEYMNDSEQTAWSVFASDLTEASDSGRKDVARRLLMGFFSDPVFDRIRGLIILSINLFCADRILLYEGERLTSSVGWMMGDPLTKLVLMLANIYCYRSACKIANTPSLGNFNGDDAIIVYRGNQYICHYLDGVKAIGLKTSWPDTFVSNKDRIFIYSEEVGLLPRSFLQIPTVAAIVNHNDILNEVLVPRRKLTTPYAKAGNGWFPPPEGRWAAYMSEYRYYQTNPRGQLLAQFWTLPMAISASCYNSRKLPCIDTRLGGNSFPLPYPCTDETVRSAIRYQERSGCQVTNSQVGDFLKKFKDTPMNGDWKEFRERDEFITTGSGVTAHVQELISQIKPVVFDDGIVRSSHKSDQNTIATLLLRTGEVTTVSVAENRLRALARYESIYKQGTILKPEREARIISDERGDLYSDEYVTAVQSMYKRGQMTNTEEITRLVKLDVIDKLMDPYRIHLQLEDPEHGAPIPNGPEEDSSEDESEITLDEPIGSIADQLISAYNRNDWAEILKICAPYRIKTDPIIEAMTRSSSEKIHIITLDNGLVNRVKENSLSKEARKLSREFKIPLLIHAARMCLEPQIRGEDDRLVEWFNTKTKAGMHQFVRTVGRLIEANNDDVYYAKGKLPDIEEFRFLPIGIVVPDWGHLRSLYMTHLMLLDNGIKMKRLNSCKRNDDDQSVISTYVDAERGQPQEG